MKTNTIELYIHIPFCKSKCRYCDFCSFRAEEGTIHAYLGKLKEELIFWGKKLAARDVVTVFIGGGTPSYLRREDIQMICETIFEHFHICEDAEITIEANPGTVDLKKLCTYRENGINRISFGLQSTVKEELEYLGRIHTYEEFLQSFDWARQAGFLPSEEDEVLMYRMTEKILNEYGYDKYEISNYAKPGFESRHNLGYWSHIPYLGVGLNASSYLDEKRFENPSDMKDYLEIQSFGDAYEGARSLSVYEQMEEFMFLGLRKTKGISKKEFIERFGCSMDSVYGKQLIESMKQGMMKEEGDRVFLTQDGILVSNQVLCEFLFDEEV